MQRKSVSDGSAGDSGLVNTILGTEHATSVPTAQSRRVDILPWRDFGQRRSPAPTGAGDLFLLTVLSSRYDKTRVDTLVKPRAVLVYSDVRDPLRYGYAVTTHDYRGYVIISALSWRIRAASIRARTGAGRTRSRTEAQVSLPACPAAL
jgi:hypothetical protein